MNVNFWKEKQKMTPARLELMGCLEEGCKIIDKALFTQDGKFLKRVNSRVFNYFEEKGFILKNSDGEYVLTSQEHFEETQRKLEKEQKEKNKKIKMRNDLQNMYMYLPFCPEPTRFFDVGEKVDIGNLEESFIIESCENGKFYLVESVRVNNNYGNPIRFLDTKYWFWYDIIPIHECEPPQMSFHDEFRLNYSQRDVNGLLSMSTSFGIDIDPDYQRGHVWDENDKVKLIDSIFNNFEIGNFVINNTKRYTIKDYLYEVIDGKQRITALLDFYLGKFKYKGLYYHEMNKRDRYHFLHYPISIGETQELSRQHKLRLFLRVNVTGIKVDEKHIEYVKTLLKEAL